VYCSDSLALAALEMLVHLRPLPRIFTPCVHYVVEIPAKMLERPKPSTLPPGWDADVAVAASRDFGSAFLSSRRAVGLIVPTAIIPEGANVVLNVAHEAFDLKWVSGPFAFNFDRRLS
jgi:RES domain-containing protein